MKTTLPQILQRATAIFAVAIMAAFTAAQKADAQLYTDTNITTGWTTARWSSSTNGPFTSAWVNNSDVIFFSGGAYNFSAPSNSLNIGNLLVESNATVKFTAINSTLGTSGNVRTFTVETNAVLDFSTQAFSTAAGTGILKEGSGVLAMAGSTYQGGFTLNGGTMVLRGINAMGSGATNVLTLSNGVIAANATRAITAGKYGGGIFIAGGIQMGALSNNYATNAQYLIDNDANISFADDVSLTGAMRTLTIGGNGTYAFGGVISNGGLTVNLASGATGRIALSGANTYTGGTVISSGTLQLGNNTASGSVVGNITNNGALAIYRTDDSYSLTNLVSGSGSLVKLGSKTVSILANNTYTGDTVISNGVLSLGDGGATGSVAGGINIAAGTLQINRSDTFTMTNVISGSGRLFQAGAGTTIILGNNTTFTGNTVISNSTLQIGNGGTTGSIAGTGFNIGDGGSLVINRSDNVTLDQTITNNTNGSFVQLGAGTTTLTATPGSIFKGGILVSNGTLQLGDGTQSFALSDGGITNNSILIWNRSGNGNVSNAISGTGTFIKMGSGNLYILEDGTYTGGTIISNGVLALGNAGIHATVAGDINIADSNAALRVMRDDTFTMTNQISGVGKFVQFGSGTLILTADNTYSGSTTISNGILQLGDGGTSGTVGTGNIVINSAAYRLAVKRSDSLILSNVISGSGQLDQLGSGTTTLAGNNTFTGATTITAGTLELKADSGSALGGTTSASVASGATLLLSRSDQVNNASAITLSGGTIQRASGVSETFGNLNLAAASFLDYGTGDTGTLTFGTYTPSSLLTVNNFFEGNTLVFSSDLTSTINNPGLFSFGNDFKYDWDSGAGTFTITAIPEPSAYAAATVLLGLMLWRRAKRASQWWVTGVAGNE